MSAMKTRVGLRSDTNRRGSDSAMKTSNDSFDRFGDDLCQHLLSFLSFEDRFRYECLSKQTERLVFTTQTDLMFDDYSKHKIDAKLFETIVKKCEHMSRIDFDYMNLFNVLKCNSIIKHCRHLNDITIVMLENVDNFDNFFAEFSPQLKSIEFYIGFNSWAQNVKLCTNLVEIHIIDDNNINNGLHLLIGDQNEKLLPRLEKISFRFNNICAQSIASFAQNYKTSLKSIDIEMNGCEETSFVTLMNGLSQMKALIELKLKGFAQPLVSESVFANQLKQIGVNCAKLKRLTLRVGVDPDDNTDDNYNELMKSINYCKQLKRLDIRCINEYGEYIRIQFTFTGHIDDCKSLTHIYGLPDELFYVNISQKFPKLESIECWHLTDDILLSLSKLSKLRTIQIYGEIKLTIISLKKFRQKYPKISLITKDS